MYKILAQFFPNNEIRATMFKAQSPKAEAEVSNEGDLFCENDSHSSCASAPVEGCDSPLDISSELETEQNSLKPGFGKMGRYTRFGLNAKRTIQRVGGAIDQDYRPSDVIFLTGTCPGSTVESYRLMAKWSSYLVQRLKAWVNKHVPSKKDFYVWELQRRGALHLHYAVCCSDGDSAEYLIKHFKSEWYRLLSSISERSGIDCFKRESGGSWRDYPTMLQAYAQRVRSSVAAYLAKYCGKSKDSIHSSDFYPVRWWGASRPALVSLRQKTREFTLESLTFNAAKIWMRNKFSTALDVCQKSYAYLHKVGTGESFVSYPYKHQLEALWNQIKPSEKVSMTSIQRSSMIREIHWSTASFHAALNLSYSHSPKLQELSTFTQKVLRSLPSRCSSTQLLHTMRSLASVISGVNFSLMEQRMTVPMVSRLRATLSLCEYVQSQISTTSGTDEELLRLWLEGLDKLAQSSHTGTSYPATGADALTAATKDTIPQRAVSYHQLSFL